MHTRESARGREGADTHTHTHTHVYIYIYIYKTTLVRYKICGRCLSLCKFKSPDTPLDISLVTGTIRHRLNELRKFAVGQNIRRVTTMPFGNTPLYKSFICWNNYNNNNDNNNNTPTTKRSLLSDGIQLSVTSHN